MAKVVNNEIQDLLEKGEYWNWAEKGFDLWNNYMKSWSDLGINHVQFNMVDNETLIAAQKEPEDYPELLVRVAGYSAHFVELNRKTQDSMIARTVQSL